MKKSVQAKSVTTVKRSANQAAGKGVATKVAVVNGTKRAEPSVDLGSSATKLTVTFGEASVRVAEPTEAVVQKGLKASVTVMRHLGKRLLTPGVEIKRANNIPLFTADPSNPDRVVRQLAGKSEAGRFVHGKFKVETVLG